ncbi:MAG: 4Fe-4S dicluster domain-containing protein [Promethearchaeota archaeon]
MVTVNFELRNELIKHNLSLTYCYQCSTCSSGCPLALITNGRYNPRKIIEYAILGLINDLIEKPDSSIWLCSTCQKCVELCPQNVELTEIFTVIKNKSFKEGKAPEAFISQALAIFDNGIAIPYSKAILSRREKLGLPDVKPANMDELKKIFEATNFGKNFKKEGD